MNRALFLDNDNNELITTGGKCNDCDQTLILFSSPSPGQPSGKPVPTILSFLHYMLESNAWVILWCTYETGHESRTQLYSSLSCDSQLHGNCPSAVPEVVLQRREMPADTTKVSLSVWEANLHEVSLRAFKIILYKCLTNDIHGERCCRPLGVFIFR